MSVRGIRGATTVSANEEQSVLDATRELLEAIVAKNRIQPDDIASVFITMSPDLNATFPARAIRAMTGWEAVPLMCASEIDVPGALSRCIRLMVLVNTDRTPSEIRHVYLGKARRLRPDLAEKGPDDC
ncbi:chorismate mutase [Melghirimyces profundicolus]|uniref:chorismate mutase n=1 Tax=Melghirimyces profundicolus TaxID=1242148 RepID=A0A2T6BVA7_9BACL|nr:chorismate mutase [Melghirimyces profundicolus]PTX59907.1 chorismate mutase [Melghirimyces profundicolus]